MYYPTLVLQFYENMHEENERYFTEVGGKRFEITPKMLHQALRLPYKGAKSLTHSIYLKEAHLAMTEEDLEELQVEVIQYNANNFPPLQ